MSYLQMKDQINNSSTQAIAHLYVKSQHVLMLSAISTQIATFENAILFHWIIAIFLESTVISLSTFTEHLKLFLNNAKTVYHL